MGESLVAGESGREEMRDELFDVDLVEGVLLSGTESVWPLLLLLLLLLLLPLLVGDPGRDQFGIRSLASRGEILPELDHLLGREAVGVHGGVGGRWLELLLL